ncbi:hypothetical protein J0X19_10110 [Hymenobacter sp. BT186]|uniref:Uncharacterized protein n=1 Tax=Hymenobacter telluris TaxID=2816474 RepID=A0A939EXA4_9BACT|nr:hypothetical protein [Hymenobacter telluris]MBO0358297.1 hypothetical protein [Hymenobacter telluris]MBW3374323.1 hypothetical protein [Hymenobacter norwichensis]
MPQNYQLLQVPAISSLFKRIVYILHLLCILFGSQQVRGQTRPDTSRSVSASVAVLEKRYAQAFAAHPQLYNGPEYVDYAKRYHARIGHQYFLTDKQQPGSVYYNNHYFSDLLLSYDVVLDQLVIQHVTSPLLLRFIDKDVRSFTIDQHRFLRIETDSTASTAFRTGYYEVLVDSAVQLLAKRAKRRQEKLNQRYVDIEFSSIDRLFLRKNSTYYPVKSKGSLTRLFADHSKEVQKYIQDNKLRFRKASREADIVQLTRYYAGLRPQ